MKTAIHQATNTMTIEKRAEELYPRLDVTTENDTINIHKREAYISAATEWKSEADKLREVLEEISPLIDLLINMTETGDKRNELCDLNIKTKSAVNNYDNFLNK